MLSIPFFGCSEAGGGGGEGGFWYEGYYFLHPSLFFFFTSIYHSYVEGDNPITPLRKKKHKKY